MTSQTIALWVLINTQSKEDYSHRKKRHRHNSSESSSDDDSSDDSSQKRNKKRRQHSSQDRQRHRNQRSDSSDSGHDSKMIRSKVNLNQKSNRSGGRKRRSVSVESDRSPVRERKDGSKSRQAEAQRRDRKRRSSSGDSSGSENRKKRSNRKRSPSEKRERRKHSDSDSEEPSSPTKPVLASRVNYMKSLNPDRSKWMPKKKSPSRRKVQSLADDYMRGEQQSSRWRVESLADDYRKDRYRNSSRGDRDRKDERGKGRDERSPRRKSPKGSQIRSAERHSFDRSPRRSPKRRSRDRSLEKNISPERKPSEVKRRSPRRSPLQRSPHMQISPKRRSPERSPKRHRSADRQRSSFKGSVEKARSPDRQKAPVRRSPARRSQDRQSSPLRRSTERQRARLRKSLEKSPTPQSPDRQATRSLDRQRSLELHSPVKRVPVRRPPLQRNQRRQSPEERSIQRLSAERIYAPQDRQEADPRSSVRRLSGRPLARRRSEEDLSSRFSPEGSFVQRASIDRPLSRRSPGISPLRPLSRRRSSAERSFPVRRSLEGNVNQRYLALSPPRPTEPRIRARSLERISRRTDTDRLSQREMQPNIFRRFRRDSDRGLYDDLPEPMGIRSPPIERRWREEPEYLNRYRDDMDLPQRSVYVDRDVNVRVLNDRSDESDERTFRYRDHRGNKAFNRPRPSQFQGRRQQRNDEPFRFMENRNWRSERNELHETDADNHRSAEMIEPKRRRLDVNIRRGSLSPTRGWGRSGENPRAVIISRSRSPVSPERNRENRNATRNASRSSSESEEESPAHGSKLSSTVTMVSRKEKHVRSPPMQLKNDKVKKTSSEEHDRIRSSRRQSYSPQRLKRETMDHLRMEKDKLVPLKKRSRSPEQSVRGRNNTDVLEMDKSDKKSLKSPRKSKRDHTATKDRSVSSRKSSRSPLQSPTRPMDSNRSATERGRSDRSIRSNQLSPKERLDSVTSEQEQEFTRAFEMERMDSMVSEQDFGRSFERERFDSTASEQEMLQRSQSIDVEEEGRDNVDDYESGPESGELTDSDEEAAKKNALIKSLVNKPSLEELDADEEERQRLEDQHYLEEKRQQALERIEAEKETVASKVVKVTDSRKDKEERRERGRDDKRDNKRKRHAEDVSGSKPDTSQLEQEPVPKKKPKPDPTGAEALTMRTGGAYIPPAKLRAMQESITDKSSVAYQRMSWEALKKSINGLINKVNVSNIEYIVRELFQENIVRGRGLMARSIIQAQAASPTFTHVYAALVAIVNTKFPQNGELILRRLVIQFRRGFKRNDKSICLSTTRFVAHLVNQQVAHEVLALEILTLLLETPTDDSVEIAVGFLKECGQKLTEVTPRGINAIFERLRNVLHEGQIDIRVQYMVEVMFAVRKDGFKDHPSVLEDLDLVEEEDQFTHLLTLEDAGDPENMLNVFKADPDFLENEEKYKILKKEILDEGSSDEEGEGGSGSDSDSEDSEGEEGEGEKQAIIDNTETNLVALRRTIYLTIQSSLDFEECAHKLMKMELKPGQESELCYMVLDCCAQMRTYEKFFGLLAQRFCMIDKKYIAPFQTMFKEQYDTIHRLETNKLRNVAKFFAHLLHTDAISWEVLSCIRLNEEETTSASRIFIKILVQELSEYMGLPNLNERLKDPTLQESFEGLLPRDNPRNTRFAINFFTTIGLGGLTDDLRDHLKNVSKKLMEQKQQEEEAAESSSSTQSESSASESSSEESSDSSEEERKKKKKKRGDKVKDKAKNKKDKHGKKSVANGTVEKEKRGKKLRKGKSGVQEESAQKRAERLRQLANYNANAGQVDPEISRSKDLDSNGDRRSGRDSSRSHKEDRISRTRDNERRDSFDRPRDPSEDREVRGRRDRILSDDEHYREQDMETGRRDYRAVQRQVSYEDGDRNQRRRIDRSFDKGDRYDNRYESLDNLNARNDNFRQSYDGRGRNQYRNFNVGDNRRQKGGYAAGNLGYRNIRGRNRGDGRMDRNLGRNRSEERTTHAARDDRRDDRRRR